MRKTHFAVILVALIISVGLLPRMQQLAFAAPTTFTVTNNNDSGAGSLRQAIIDANANSGADTIVFSGAFSIALLTQLPDITEDLEINGYTGSPGGATANTAAAPAPLNGTLTIELDGSALPNTSVGPYNCIRSIGADNVIIRGLVINNCGNSGIELRGSNYAQIQGNYIGTDIGGTVDQGNGRDYVSSSVGMGVRLKYSNNALIGGTDPEDRNVIAGNQANDIFIENESDNANQSENNTIQGNFIGVGKDGTTALPSGFATGLGNAMLFGNSHNDQIGGTASGAMNVIGSSYEYGVSFRDGCSGSNIEGNYIGTDYTGNATLSHSQGTGHPSGGVHVSIVSGAGFTRASNNITIGGTSAAARNVISGNTGVSYDPSGVEIADGGYSSTIIGNYIGVGADGTTALGNEAYGVRLQGAGTGNVIGGDTADERNVISDNSMIGVLIESDSNTVIGNYIGTTADGLSDLGNTQAGVALYSGADNNTIGTSNSGEGNIISGNGNHGIELFSTNTTSIAGNYIGLGSDGSTIIANDTDGIYLSNALSTTVGGASTSARNVISGNAGSGINIASGSLSTEVKANYIGVDVTGLLDKGNNQFGVANYSDGAVIGGSTTDERNIISGNTWNGVRIVSADNSVVSGNYIGLGSDGSTVVSNGLDGVYLDNAQSTTIGGTSTSDRNVISGNGNGINVTNNSANAVIKANYIGVDSTGLIDKGNTGAGVLSVSDGTVVGGTNSGETNVISGNGSQGVNITGADLASIAGNYIGLGSDGTTVIANDSDGIYLDDAQSVTVGGTATTARNIISGNADSGINVTNGSTSAAIKANYIGVDVTGLIAKGNSTFGIESDSSGTAIGGITVAERNVISANTSDGVDLNSSSATVYGNYIGVDANGTAALANGGVGVDVNASASNTTIGSSTSGSGNVISGNASHGVLIASGATSTSVAGNNIGVNSSGNAAIANGGDGVNDSAVGTVIGGTATSARNIISGNTSNGVLLSGTTSGNSILGNYIGTNAAGTSAVANGVNGISDAGSSNTIGDGSSDGRNLIAGNTADGIGTTGSSLQVRGNYIGLGSDGTTSIGNGDQGIELAGTNATVGGTTSGQGNYIVASTNHAVVISSTGNTLQGNTIGIDVSGAANANGSISAPTIAIAGSGNTIGGTSSGAKNIIAGASGGAGIGLFSSNNIIQGNTIGLNASGAVESGYGFSAGIVVINVGSGDPDNNLIGGTASGAANTIAGNGDGILIYTDALGTPINQAIVGNSIHSNSGGTLSDMGIELASGPAFTATTDLGPNANDADDADSGANDYLNNPVLNSTSATSGSLDINFDLDIPDVNAGVTMYRVEFFANSSGDTNGGEGEILLGSKDVAGDVTGDTATITVPAEIASDGNYDISATTTEVDGSSDGFGATSEFATNLTNQQILVQDTDNDSISDATENAGPNSGDANGDGTQDSVQANVATTRTGDSSGWVTLELPASATCNTISEFSGSLESSQATQDSAYVYPFDLVHFEIPCADSATVTLLWHEADTGTNYSVRKVGPTTPGDNSTVAWYDFPSSVTTRTVGGGSVVAATLSLTDNQLGDDTGDDNQIVDDAGLVVATELAATGSSALVAMHAAVVLIVMGLWFMRLRMTDVSVK